MRDYTASDQRKRGRRTVEARNRRRLRPTLMALEERTVLSTFAVTLATDPASITMNTLRWAVQQANAATSLSSISIELGTSA